MFTHRYVSSRPAWLATVVVSVAASLLCSGLVTPAGAATSRVVADRRPATAALQDAMNQLVGHQDGSPGIVVTIGRGSHLSVLTAGVSDVMSHAKPTARDHMRLASVAKPFSGAAALSLVATGQLALTDTVGTWLPDLPRTWAHVTLRNLLAHTSGIHDFIKFKAFQEAVNASPQTPPGHRELLSFITDPTLVFPPGSKYEYSNSDNIIIGLMVEAAAHRSYETVLARNVLRPLHLTQTSLPNDSAIRGPYLHGCDVTPPQPPDDVTHLIAAGWSWASGGIVSTSADAIRFIQGYVRGATTDRATRAAQFTFRAGSSEPPGPGVNAVGLAVFRYDTRCGTVYGHTGNTPGYTQFVAATRDGYRAVAVSINAQTTPSTNAQRFPELRHVFELAVCAAMSRS